MDMGSIFRPNQLNHKQSSAWVCITIVSHHPVYSTALDHMKQQQTVHSSLQ